MKKRQSKGDGVIQGVWSGFADFFHKEVLFYLSFEGFLYVNQDCPLRKEFLLWTTTGSFVKPHLNNGC